MGSGTIESFRQIRHGDTGESLIGVRHKVSYVARIKPRGKRKLITATKLTWRPYKGQPVEFKLGSPDAEAAVPGSVRPTDTMAGG